MRVVAFLAVVLTVVTGAHSYLWWRLVRNTTRPGRGRRLSTAAIVALAALLPATLIGTRALPRGFEGPLAWTGYLWRAIMFYLLVYLLILEVPRVAVWVVGRLRRVRPAPAEPVLAAERGAQPVLVAEHGAGPATGVAGPAPGADKPADPGRRLFLARSLAATAGVAALGTVAFGVRTATGPIPLKRVRVTLDRLDPALDGFTIALLSDVHLGPTARREFLEPVVETVNGAGVGLVAIVGDLVDGDVTELGPDAAALRELRSRHGTYFVTGNHEYFSGVAQWVEYLPSLGVRVLHDERETIAEAGAAFLLAGSVRAGDPARPPAGAVHRGRPARGRPAALRPHARRADGAVQLPGPAGPARRRRAVPGRRQPALRHARRRHLGPAGPGRRPARDHRHRTPLPFLTHRTTSSWRPNQLAE